MRTKARSCDGKQRHDTEAAAIAQMYSLLRRGAVRLNTYRCAHCSGWHVGHRPKPRT